MKKSFYLILITLFSVLVCSSCAKSNDQAAPDKDVALEPTIYEKVNTYSDVTMEVKKGSVSSSGLTVIFENRSTHEGVFSEDFVLEKRVHDEWGQVLVTIEGNYGFQDIGFQLDSGSQVEWTVDWTWLYGSLEQGEYRIIKNVLDFRKTGDFDEHHLTAEFIFK